LSPDKHTEGREKLLNINLLFIKIYFFFFKVHINPCCSSVFKEQEREKRDQAEKHLKKGIVSLII